MTPYGMLRYRGQQSSATPPYGRCWCRLPHPVLLYSSLPRQWSPTLPLPHPHHYSFDDAACQSGDRPGLVSIATRCRRRSIGLSVDGWVRNEPAAYHLSAGGRMSSTVIEAAQSRRSVVSFWRSESRRSSADASAAGESVRATAPASAYHFDPVAQRPIDTTVTALAS